MTTNTSYMDFLDTKRLVYQGRGVEVAPTDINAKLFDFQRAITSYALRKGRCAIFADTGLGKTFMQVEWSRLTPGRGLIVAPLTVAGQTVEQAKIMGVDVQYARSQTDATGNIVITNYEMLDHFDPSQFDKVVLDESSILKGMDGKTRAKLTEMFAQTPYKLCCTATPAPNDITEIANHAEFLGIMTRAEMLASFFVHDDQGWRLKGHAEEGFFRWMASWGMSIRLPSDLGFSDDGYILPPLSIEPLWVSADEMPTNGRLFHGSLKGVGDRAALRKSTIADRVAATTEMVNESPEQWIVWCGLNDEGREAAKLIPGSVLVEGSQSPEFKIAAIEAFQRGEHRVLVTKPRIAGFGLNFQNAHEMAFLGMNDSWESYYQCIRRCYRFGQTHPVKAHIVLSEAERPIYDNVMRKESEARDMSEKLIANVAQYERSEIGQSTTEWSYQMDIATGHDYKLMLGDSAERMSEIADESVGLSVFSPPFMSLYTYSPTERDMGNSRTPDEFYQHFQFIINELLRVTQPGRNCCVHVQQISTTLATHGVIGMRDFRGEVIREFVNRGWVYHGEVCIDKDPQAQAIRTHLKSLLFVQLRKDSSWSRPAFADYIIIFRKPGENPAPIHPSITNDEWIEYARPIWYGIRESDTLNTAVAKENSDDRHICPLQLGTIDRCVKLWSNPGEIVFSPFAGIGSEGYVALQNGRQFIGIELKRSYWESACRNLETALTRRAQGDLFSDVA